MTKKELEKRLITFAADVVNLVSDIEQNPANTHLRDQIIRSATACSLNYGEAQSAESRRDFLHKISIVMKELRETYANLTILSELKQNAKIEGFVNLIKETDELIAIMYKTIQTTRKNS